MSDLNSALLTSISQRSEESAAPRLAGSVVARGVVSSAERREMYRLLETYFSGTSLRQFEADLAEKELVFLLRDSVTGQIQGFSTSMRLSARIDDEDVVAFFSGDTIIAREYWGDSLLARLWSQKVFAEADLIHAARPSARVYWYLICSGYRTWRFLPVFFREYWPNMAAVTPAHQQSILDTLGQQKFGSQYVRGVGVVHLRSAAPLRSGISDITEKRMTDHQVAFFARMNPGHIRGDELACLTEITRSNLTRAGRRMVGSAVGQ
jgi:hypothetical protein